jgi:PEP-CTERM motif
MRNLVTRLSSACLLAVFAAVVASAGAALASPAGGTIDFQNGQGTVTGYFETDTTGNVTSWDLQTSTFDCSSLPCPSGFPGIHYTQANSTASVGFHFGVNQTISFFYAPTSWELFFEIDCGGGGADCIGTAAIGSTFGLSGSEFESPDGSPDRALVSALLEVSDPSGGLSFNLAPLAVPEPCSLGLLGVGLAGLSARHALRRRAGAAG